MILPHLPHKITGGTATPALQDATDDSIQGMDYNPGTAGSQKTTTYTRRIIFIYCLSDLLL